MLKKPNIFKNVIIANCECINSNRFIRRGETPDEETKFDAYTNKDNNLNDTAKFIKKVYEKSKGQKLDDCLDDKAIYVDKYVDKFSLYFVETCTGELYMKVWLLKNLRAKH